MINLRNLTAWGKIAETIVRWYILVIVLYAVLWIIWVLSGSNFYNMVTNMIAALVGLVIIIIIMEILRRKVK